MKEDPPDIPVLEYFQILLVGICSIPKNKLDPEKYLNYGQFSRTNHNYCKFELFGRTRKGESVYLLVNWTPRLEVRKLDLVNRTTYDDILTHCSKYCSNAEALLNGDSVVRGPTSSYFETDDMTDPALPPKQRDWDVLEFASFQNYARVCNILSEHTTVLETAMRWTTEEKICINASVDLQLAAGDWVKFTPDDSVVQHSESSHYQDFQYIVSPKHLEKVSREDLKTHGLPALAPFKVLSYDIETLSADPPKFTPVTNLGSKIIVIGSTTQRVGSKESKKVVFCLGDSKESPDFPIRNCSSELGMLSYFAQYYREENPDIHCHWNGYSFDDAQMYDRVLILVNHFKQTIEKNWNEGHRSLRNLLGDKNTADDLIRTLQKKKWDEPVEDITCPNIHRAFFALNKVKLKALLWGRRDKASNWRKEKPLKTSAFGELRWKLVMCHGRVAVDGMIWFARQDSTLRLRSGYSLKSVAEKFFPKEVELQKIDLSYQDMWKEYLSGPEGRLKVCEYCLRDAELPWKLLDHNQMLLQDVELANRCFTPLHIMITYGQLVRSIGQHMDGARRKGFIFGNIDFTKEEGESYDGGAVLEPILGLHDNCTIHDFTSLYPTIIKIWFLCLSNFIRREDWEKNKDVPFVEVHIPGQPEAIRIAVRSVSSIFSDLVSRTMTDRKKVQATIPGLTGIDKTVAHIKQLTLKLNGNSFYGYIALVKMFMGALVTYWGRKLLECAKEISMKTFVGFDRFFLNRFIPSSDREEAEKEIKSITPIVVYGDTDSIMVQYQVTKFERKAFVDRYAMYGEWCKSPDKLSLFRQEYMDKKLHTEQMNHRAKTCLERPPYLFVWPTNRPLPPKPTCPTHVDYNEAEFKRFLGGIEKLIGKDEKYLENAYDFELLYWTSEVITSAYVQGNDLKGENHARCIYTLKKKKYAKYMSDSPDKPYYVKISGLDATRRDNCAYTANLQKDFLSEMLKGNDKSAVIKLMDNSLALLEGKVDPSLLLISGKLKENYVHAKPPHAVLADRLRKTDHPIQFFSGSRVSYLMVVDPHEPLGNPIPILLQEYLDPNNKHELAKEWYFRKHIKGPCEDYISDLYDATTAASVWAEILRRGTGQKTIVPFNPDNLIRAPRIRYRGGDGLSSANKMTPADISRRQRKIVNFIKIDSSKTTQTFKRKGQESSKDTKKSKTTVKSILSFVKKN